MCSPFTAHRGGASLLGSPACGTPLFSTEGRPAEVHRLPARGCLNKGDTICQGEGGEISFGAQIHFVQIGFCHFLFLDLMAVSW